MMNRHAALQVSGPYPRSVLQDAIAMAEGMVGGKVSASLNVGEALTTNSFDALGVTSAVTAMIGVGIAAAQLAISILRERRERMSRTNVDAAPPLATIQETREMVQHEEYSTVTTIRRWSSEDVDLEAMVVSRTRIASLKVVSRFAFEDDRGTISVEPFRKGTL